MSCVDARASSPGRLADLAVLVSVRPKWCKKIFDGDKLVEIRKTRPNLEPPFKLYIYCTKPSKKSQTVSGSMVINTDELFHLPNGTMKHDWSGELMVYPSETWSADNFLNGKVIGEVICSKISAFHICEWFKNGCVQVLESAGLYKSCLTYEDVSAYVGIGKTGYAWHLTNMILYDAPKSLRAFHRPCANSLFCESCGMFNFHPDPGFCGNAALQIKRPPQSWCYVEPLYEDSH